MNNTSAIRLLAAANNERGDLFTRLTKDLFFALGYDDLRLDVHKSGRELDIQGEHRFETRRVVGECKAHNARMGGTELNTFFGALTRERKRFAPVPVAGYFVSLSGFTETGIKQENETGDDRVILLDAEKVVEELEKCRVIVGRTEAAERAGHCAQQAGLPNAVLDSIELLGHQRGYLWAIYYAQGKERTHFALIHADGTPLAEAVAQEVIYADNLCDGSLHTLRYLAPPVPALDRVALAARVAASYRQWVSEDTWGDCDLFLRQIITNEDYDLQLAAWIVGWYRRAPWNDAELVEHLSNFIIEPFDTIDPTVRRLLENLGDEGRQVLKEANRKRAEFEAAQSKQDTTTS